MLAALGLAAALFPHGGIGLGSAVAANQVNRLVGPKLLVQGPDQIDQRRVHIDLFVGPPIAHESVELLERRLSYLPSRLKVTVRFSLVWMLYIDRVRVSPSALAR